MSYSVLDSFSLSQFISRTVVPPLMPNICVCTAPETPTVHKSLLLELILGEIALGGGDFTVVVAVLLLFTVLSLVLSVTIDCALANENANNADTVIIIFFTRDSRDYAYIYVLSVFLLSGTI